MTKFNKTINKRIAKVKQPKKKKYHTMFNNRYQFRFWILVPLVLIVEMNRLRQEKSYESLEWDEVRAKRIIDKVFPKVCDIDKNTHELFFNREWTGIIEREARKKDKRFCGKFRYQILDFIQNTYEIEGYTKKIDDQGYGEILTIFERKA